MLVHSGAGAWIRAWMGGMGMDMDMAMDAGQDGRASHPQTRSGLMQAGVSNKVTRACLCCLCLAAAFSQRGPIKVVEWVAWVAPRQRGQVVAGGGSLVVGPSLQSVSFSASWSCHPLRTCQYGQLGRRGKRLELGQSSKELRDGRISTCWGFLCISSAPVGCQRHIATDQECLAPDHRGDHDRLSHTCTYCA